MPDFCCSWLRRAPLLALLFGLTAVGCSEDDPPSGPPQCPAGQVFSSAENRCVDETPTVDMDADGVAAEDDCDDSDASLGARSADADCDGVLTADDCDDADPTAGSNANDMDCDGIASADDCDDADAMVGSNANDMDCDGVAAADDCDDADAMAGATANDMDCDGITTAADCDDMDAMAGAIAADMDCDGIATADDCDDTDAMVGPRSADADCDGVLTAADCDDTDVNLGAITLDRDCDGTINDQDECPDDANFIVSPPPEVVSTFPTPMSTTNAETLSFTGVVQLFCDNTADEIVARVNGEEAVVTTEMAGPDRVRYRFSRALDTDAANVATVDARDSANKTASATVSVAQYTIPAPPAFAAARGITLNPATNVIYVADDGLPGVYAIDLATRQYTVLSGPTVGAGPAFSSDLEGGIDYDASGSRVLVTDDGNDAVYAVDLATGDRTEVSGPNVGTGTAFTSPFGIEVDAANNRAFLVDTTLDAVVEIDLTTGNRSILSSDGVQGMGPDMTSPRDVTVDLAGGRLFVVDTNLEGVIAVDLATGDRMIVSDVDVGTGPALPTPRGVTLDSANNRVLVAESGNGFEAVIAVDLTTGNRTELSGRNVGAGPILDSTRGILIDSPNNRLIVVDETFTTLVAVSLANGDRSAISPSAVPPPGLGVGPDLESPTGVAFDRDNNLLYVVDDGPNSVVAVDLDTGDRSILADDSSPGVVLLQPRGIGFDPANNRLLIPDNNSLIDGIVGISLTTGEGTIVSGDDSPDEMSETFASPRNRVAIEPGGTTALVADTSRDSLFRFDLMTGERFTVVEGDDSELEGIQNVDIDAANDRALITVASTGDDQVLDGLLSVDLTTGSTTTLASRSTDMPAVGSGVDMTNPRGLAFDEANNRALVFDSDLDALISIDLATLARTVLSDSMAGGGDLLGVVGNNANYIELDGDNQRVFAVSETSGQVVLIDLASGDQVVVTR